MKVTILLALAISCFASFCQAQYADITQLYAQAQEAERTKNYSQAINLYSEVILQDALYADAYYQRGLCYLRTSRQSDAVRDFTRVISLRKNHKGAYLYRGVAHYNLNRYDDAIQDFFKELINSPKDKLCYNNIALCYEKQGKYQQALENYNKALEIDPQYQTAKTNKDALAQRMNSLSPIVKTEAGFAAAREQYEQGLDACEQGTYELGITYFNKAIDIDPRYKRAYDQRGWARFQLGRFAEALKDFDKSIELGNDVWTLTMRGKTRLKLRQPTEALADFTSALKINPNHADAQEGKRSAEQMLSASVDRTPPNIVITHPEPTRGMEVVRMDTEVTVTGKATDESGTASVYVNGIDAKVNLNGDFRAQIKLADGPNKVYVIATDFRGNKGERVFTINKPRGSSSASGSTIAPTNPATTSNQTGKTKRHALFIATDEYDDNDWPDLSNPVRDARAVATELQKYYGFNVDMLINATKEQIVIKLREYATRNFDTDDQLFIFIAGHGHFDDVSSDGFLVAKDSRKNDAIFQTYLSHTQLRTYINNIKCEHVFLTMDVCFGGTFDPIVARRGSSETYGLSRDEFIARKMQFKTRRYLTSGGKEYVSDGAPGKHSPFARKMLEALRSYGGTDGLLTIDELVDYMKGMNPQAQYGSFGDDEPGSDFLFIVSTGK